MQYDLEERTGKFGENIIGFAKSIKLNEITKPLISQIVRSGTSIGANYMEANQASSRKDFKNRISICRKEANETKHWLRMIAKADDNIKGKCKDLWKESHAFTLIFSKIIKTTNEKLNH